MMYNKLSQDYRNSVLSTKKTIQQRINVYAYLFLLDLFLYSVVKILIAN